MNRGLGTGLQLGTIEKEPIKKSSFRSDVPIQEPQMNSNDFLVFDGRPSDSPLIERVWRSYSIRAGTFLSVAASKCGIVFSRHRGKMRVTLRGPETKATVAECPADGEWFGIMFAMGTYFPKYPAAMLMDRQDLDLAEVTPRRFWLLGRSWDVPDFNNAENFVAQLVRTGVITHDPSVSMVLRGEGNSLSRRTAQRHFLHATGMTYDKYRQIERARYALSLLRQGASVLDATYQAGYFDQAHLTRSLRRFAGDTPARLRRSDYQLSLLYKTDSTC
jgi:hypothetical protein